MEPSGASLPVAAFRRRRLDRRSERQNQVSASHGSAASWITRFFPLVSRASRVLAGLVAGIVCICQIGCLPNAGTASTGVLESTWGRRGMSEGRLQKPRAMAIDADDRLYVVDMTARIQVFDRDGEFLRGWKTPASDNGRPCGLTFDRDGNLLVADTHYFRMLVYSPAGELLRTLGGECGHEPGQFSFVTDCVQDSQGNYYIAEYGDYDRVQKFTPDGQFLLQWGSHGSAPGQLIQPRSLAIDDQDHVWVADACNHRIQVFDATQQSARLVRMWGEEGTAAGQLRYPYGLALDGDGNVYVCEFGNSRVQKFTVDGEYLAYWGQPGRGEGELYEPWEIAFDSAGTLHVLDTNNHRIQVVRM